MADEYETGETDEQMLDTVSNAMGQDPRGAAGGSPPPGSGMKWEVLEEDQAALMANPSPENVDAFTQYWGEENLPPEMMGGGMGGGMQIPGAPPDMGMAMGGAPPDIGGGMESILNTMQQSAKRSRPGY